MKKATRLVLGLLIVSITVPMLYASSQFVGSIVQPVSITGTPSITVTGSTVSVQNVGGTTLGVSATSLPLPTGAATSALQTTEIGYLAVLGSSVPVNVLNNVSVTGSTVSLQASGTNLTANGSGALNVNVTNSQSVSGSTVQVTGLNGGAVAVSAASLPLPTGAATSALQPGYGSAGTPSANVVTVQGITGGTALPVTSSPSASTTVTKANVSATTTSAQLLAASSTRLGVECTSLCTNTDYVYLNINSASAAANTDYPLSPCSSWVPPVGMIPTGAIQVIANSGTQVVRCVSYTP